jgi:TetR/AcrR family transcriptional regulator
LTELVKSIDRTAVYEKFLRLDPEKQRRVVNASLSEFAAKGFRQASTDDIVAKAGISKGALFHYFGSKEKLYLFLLEWSASLMEEEIYGKIDWDQPDFFARLLQGSKLKLEALLSYPELWGFWETFMSERPEFASDWIDDKAFEAGSRSTQLLLEGVDTSRFKPGMDLEKMANVVVWTFSGWTDAILAESRMKHERVDLRRVFAEADDYVEFLRAVFCVKDVEVQPEQADSGI